MPPTPVPASLSDLSASDLLGDLLAVSMTGLIYYTPLYDPAGTGGIVDFTFVYLNPAAQRMMHMPEVPVLTHNQQWPHSQAHGTFAFHVDAFVSGEPRELNINYQADGYDNYYRLAARRSGDGLLVSFTDTADQPRSPVEIALRDSQARERAQLAEAERERQRLYALLENFPAVVASYRGPEHVFELVSHRFQRDFPTRTIKGQPVREALPELEGQGYYDILDGVYRTGEPFRGTELETWVDRTDSGQLALHYYNVFFQATRDDEGRIDGILNFAYDVTAEVLARQQVQQLNQELEARVQARTQEVEAARREAEQARQRLAQAFRQAPFYLDLYRGPAHVFELVHPLTQQLLGERALLGRPRREALPELGEEAHRPLDVAYATGKAQHQAELRTPITLIGPDGSPGEPLREVYFDIVYQPLVDEGGRVEGVLTLSVDVTERVLARRQAEALQAQALATAQHQAAERESFYHIFEQTPAVVALLRAPAHRFEYVNPAYQVLFPGRPLVGRYVVEAVPELAAQGFVALMNQVYQSGDTYFGQELPFTPEPPPGQAPRTGYYNFTYQAYREDGAVAGITILGYDVTEQVQARREREAEQRQLHELFMQAPAPIVILDGPELVFQLVNPAYQRIFPGRELAGKPLLEALPELVGTSIPDLFRRVYDTGEPVTVHELPLRMARHEGHAMEEIYWTFTYQARRAAHGIIDGVRVFAHEVTDQVRARRVVEASEQQVRALVGSAPFPIGVYVGPDHRIQLANDALLTAWGKGRDVVGQRFADVLPELTGQPIFGHLHQVLRTGEPLHLRNERVELVIDGQLQPFYYNYSFTPLRDARGQVYGVLNTAADVTDLAQARQRIESYAAELQESEARFRIMADAAPNQVWAVNPDSTIRYANQAFLDFVGTTLEEYVAMGWSTLLHPQDLVLAQHTLDEAIRTGSLYVLEHRMRRHDGQYRWLLSQGAPSFYANGDLYGYVGSAIDITELKQTNERLTRTNQDLDNFVYAASHDLKQPVNNLVGLFEELHRSIIFADPAEEQLLVPMIAEALQQLGLTIDDLATLGQAQQVSEAAAAEQVSLADLTEEVVNTLEPQVRAARARITVDFTARPAVAFARANLRTILLNLIGNSLKYADPARPARIHLSVWVEDRQPVLVVEDNGLGFDAQKHGAELFHLFRRLHTHTTGSGVGLYLVNRIVQACGGSIEVDSQPGEGATFRIRLGRA